MDGTLVKRSLSIQVTRSVRLSVPHSRKPWPGFWRNIDAKSRRLRQIGQEAEDNGATPGADIDDDRRRPPGRFDYGFDEHFRFRTRDEHILDLP